MSTKGHGQSSGRQTYLDWIGERSHDRGKKLWLNNAISRKSNSQSGRKICGFSSPRSRRRSNCL
jgi:hypothetical protein